MQACHGLAWVWLKAGQSMAEGWLKEAAAQLGGATILHHIRMSSPHHHPLPVGASSMYFKILLITV